MASISACRSMICFFRTHLFVSEYLIVVLFLLLVCDLEVRGSVTIKWNTCHFLDSPRITSADDAGQEGRANEKRHRKQTSQSPIVLNKGLGVPKSNY